MKKYWWSRIKPTTPWVHRTKYFGSTEEYEQFIHYRLFLPASNSIFICNTSLFYTSLFRIVTDRFIYFVNKFSLGYIVHIDKKSFISYTLQLLFYSCFLRFTFNIFSCITCKQSTKCT